MVARARDKYYHSKKTPVEEIKRRKCLKCDAVFDSKGNRICQKCYKSIYKDQQKYRVDDNYVY